jgi:signal transduction histidine kinase
VTEREPPEGLDFDSPDAVATGVGGEERVQSLLDAVLAISGDLDLHATLERIVAAAARLVGARYAALGVIDRHGDGLVDFITFGLPDVLAERIGTLPRGHGILGLIIREPSPLRLHDLNAHPEAYGFPEHHPPMKNFLGVPVRVADSIFGNLYLTDKHHSEDFTDEDEVAVVALAAAAGAVISNARSYSRGQQRERWLAATAEIQNALMKKHVDRAATLELVTTRARDVTGAEFAMVVLEQGDGSLLVEAAVGSGDHLLGSRLPLDGTLADVVLHGATVHLSQGVHIAGLDDVASALLVPFTGTGGEGGALLIGTGNPQSHRDLDDEDVQALRGFAAQVAIAMDRAQAQEDRAALAILADRDRIARDLHDVVIQRLFAAGLTLQSVARKVDDDAVADRLTSAIADLDITIRDIRGTIFELGRGDASLDLRGQIGELVSAAEQMLGFRPHVSVEGPLDSVVPQEVQPHLVAVLVESLSNVARHAQASKVEVRVSCDGSLMPDAVTVEVRDNGRGISSTRRESGLRNMRERATALNGTFVVDSLEGSGTAVRWSAPLGLDGG